MAEKLGVKRGQLEGLRDPSGNVIAGQTDPDAIKRLAQDFLARRGVVAPPAPIAKQMERDERVAIGLFDGTREEGVYGACHR